LQEEGDDKSDIISDINTNEVKCCNSDSFIRKISHGGSIRRPPMVRRNTVTRCTDVVCDVIPGVPEVRKRKVSQGPHVVWDYRITGADAATDEEYKLLMERVNQFKELYLKKSGCRDVSEDSDNNGESLTRETVARKSLPTGALKSYMRGTQNYLRRTGKVTVENENNNLVKSPSTTPQSPQQPRSPRILQRNSTSRTPSPKPHKKVVSQKPSIPHVLLKNASRNTVAINSNMNSNKDKCQTAGNSTTNKISANANKVESNTDVQYKQEKENHLNCFSPPKWSACKAEIRCEEDCRLCSLVDLWFTIWHVEFNKK